MCVRKASECSLYLIYFLLLSFLFFNGAIFSINDDFAVLNLLRDGSSDTLILSYPMSYILSFLYLQLPLIQWYSTLLFVVIGASICAVSRDILKSDLS